MPANGANHISLHPPGIIPPSSRHLERYLYLVVILLYLVWHGLAKGNNRAQPKPRLDRRRDYDTKTWLYHFRNTKALIEVHTNYCSALGMIRNSQINGCFFLRLTAFYFWCEKKSGHIEYWSSNGLVKYIGSKLCSEWISRLPSSMIVYLKTVYLLLNTNFSIKYGNIIQPIRVMSNI